MKPTPTRIRSCIALVIATTPCLSAADQYYDASGASGLTAGNAIWNSGGAAAWADNAAPGTAAPVAWVDGNHAVFQTGGTSTVTLDGTVTASALTHASGTTTLAGGGSLVLESGAITLGGGTLNIGTGTDGSLPIGASVTMSGGTALNFSRSDAAAWSGRINGVTAANGTVAKSGGGNFTLTLQGNNAFGTLTNSNTTGLLTLSTATPADEITTTLRAATGSSMAITSGTWKTPNLGQNNTGAQMRGTLTISNATVTATTSGRYTTGSYVMQDGGILRIEADRFEYNTSQSVPSAVFELDNGSLLDVSSTSFGTTIGSAAGTTTILRQNGGIARFGVTDGASTTNRNLRIGGTSTNGKSAYDLAGGTLLVRGAVLSGGAAASGGVNNFNFRGGVLAANAIATANLGSTDSTGDPVGASLSIGTLVNRGGTLAPGDIGIPGKTTVTGAYQADSGTLAIDLAGTTAASSFQGSPAQFDNVAVSGAVTLGGNLDVSLRDGFIPAPADSFTVLTAGSLSGAFANAPFDGRFTCSPSGSFLITKVGQSVVLSDFQPDPNAGPDVAYAPQSTGARVGDDVVLSIVATGDGAVTYQWRKDGVAIPGATGASLWIEQAALEDAGSYDVVLADDTGGKTSAPATLTVVAEGAIDPLVAASAYANESVWSYHASTPVPWSLFKPRDFGSSRIVFNGEGITPIGRVPAPGVHPRIFFSPEDLPAIRQRIQTTTGGQEAWKNLLGYCHWMKRTYDKNQDYAKPWWHVNHFGYTGRNPHLYRFTGSSYSEDYYTILANGGTPASFAGNPSYFFKVAAMEALRCLIEEDTAGGRKLASAVVRGIQLEQARRAASDTPQNPPRPSTPRADCSSLGLVYDFAYNFMTPAQQDFVRQELVLLSAWADNYGTFNNAEASRSNWATFSYWVFDLMAIEGETGFNDLKFLGLYRGWRNYFTYSFFDSGAAFEAEGKLPLGFDAMIAFDRVAWKYGLPPLSQHPMVRSYYSKFLPYSTLPFRNNKFVIFDILGTMGGGLTTPADLVAARYLYPNDRMVDFSYRTLVKDDYSNIPSAIHFHWTEQTVSSLFATNHDPANDPAALDTPLSFFCGQRAMMMTRSAWNTDASMLTMHTRGASGGHPYPDRNGIMFAGKGRTWITIPGGDIGGWSMNTVLIDEAQQSETTPARVVDYVDQPLATFMAGDAKYSWDWIWSTSSKDKQGGNVSREDVLADNVDTGASAWSLVNQTFNDFAYDRSSRPVYDEPLKLRASWLQMDGILEPYKRMVNRPVLKSFRSAGLVRGPRPYVLVVDDIQRDPMNAVYDWNATLPSDVALVTTAAPGATGDVILAGGASLNADGSLKPGEPALLVRVLDIKGQQQVPTLAARGNLKHLLIRTTAAAPDFKILIHAFRMGDPLPVTTWNSGRTQLAIDFPDQSDSITFTPAASGKTDIVVSRNGTTLAAVNKVVQPFADPETDAYTAGLRNIPDRVTQLRTGNYDPKGLPGFLAGWEFGATQNVPGTGPAYVPMAGSIPEAAPIPAGNSTLVAGMNGGLAASLASPGLSVPLSWNPRIRNAFTASFWMKVNTIENDKVYFSFGDHRTLGIRQRGGSLNLYALNNWYLDAGPSDMMTSWTHLAAVFTGSQLNIYRNGFLVSSYPATPANFNAFANLRLGATNGTNGAVHSVHIHDRGFTAAEVQDLFLWGRYGAEAQGAALDPLESWRSSHFGTTANAGVAADDFDHDGDGLVNLAEYALGGDPTDAGDAPRPVIAMLPAGDGNPGGTIRFTFRRARGDVNCMVERSTDLVGWEVVETDPGVTGGDVDVDLPAGGERGFLRLRVQRIGNP